MAAIDPEFPCTLTIHVPFPNHRLADAACQTLAVDQELSSLVKRSFSLVSPGDDGKSTDEKSVLKTEYKATTNRMLRVAVNGFFESLNTVVQVEEELDVDVLHEKGFDDLEGVQGVEQGLTGTTITGA